MSAKSILENATRRNVVVNIEDVIVKHRQREVDVEHVALVLESYETLGGLQLQDIILNEKFVLIDGAHRFAAAQAAGWEKINAVVIEGITEDHRNFLELEANRIRKDLSPVQLEMSWSTYHQPLLEAKATEARRAGGEVGGERFREQQAESKEAFPHNAGRPVDNSETQTPSSAAISVAQEAKRITGHDIRLLNLVREIREVAHSESAPDELRDAAKRGLEKLKRPGTPIAPVHKSLMKIKEQLESQQKAPDVLHRRGLEARVDRLESDATLLAEKLDGPLGQDLHAAAGLDEVLRESIRAIRVALTKALASVVVVESASAMDAAATVNQVGAEVTKALSELTVAELKDLGRVQ